MLAKKFNAKIFYLINETYEKIKDSMKYIKIPTKPPIINLN